MQVIERDGTARMPEVYDSEVLEKHLENPEVKEVRVFKLKKGLVLRIGDGLYKVVAVRSNGKVTLKFKSSI